MPIITCPNCGAKNRVQDNPALPPICGKCHQKLPLPHSGVITATDSSFSQLINSAGDNPVLIDCWAEWCGPCRMLTPTIDQLAAESQGRWMIAKLNVDQNQRTSQQYQISSIPTLLIFRNGQLIDRLVGLQPKQNILSKLVRAQAA